jgi:hypothetical protein
MTARGIVAAVVTFAALGSGGWVVAHGDGHRASGGDSSAHPAPIVGEGLDLLSGASAEDWVRFASFVATVTVVDEHAVSIPQEDLERGEGMIDRVVELRVDRTL